MKLTDFDVETQELIDDIRMDVATEFAEGSNADLPLAYEQCTFVDALPLDGGERLITVWTIDGQYLMCASWAPGEWEPTHQAVLLDTWQD